MWISKSKYNDIIARLGHLEASMSELESGQNIEIKNGKEYSHLLMGIVDKYQPVPQKAVIMSILSFLGLELKYEAPETRAASIKILPTKSGETWK